MLVARVTGLEEAPPPSGDGRCLALANCLVSLRLRVALSLTDLSLIPRLRESDPVRFLERQCQIFSVASANFVNYLRATWLPVVKMWSAAHRVGRSILKHVDTNMLIEAWHSVLKMKFMGGQRNRRMDNLLYLLVEIGK